jgi:hypothetical protein
MTPKSASNWHTLVLIAVWTVAWGLLVGASCPAPTGFDPGLLPPGARCTWTPDGQGSNNFFSYTPDCPSASLSPGFGTDHWIYAIYKGCTDGSQEAPVGFTDSSNNYSIHPESNFQTVWIPPNPSLGLGSGWYVNMKVHGGVAPCGDFNEADFDLENAISGGLVGLHSHHAIAMITHAGHYGAAYAIKFSFNGDAYFLSYELRPRNTLENQRGNPPGVNFNGCGTCDGHHHLVTLDAGFFGTPSIANGYVTMDIDWQGLLGYIQSHGIWQSVDITGVYGIREIFQSAGYDNPAGGVETVQTDWRMFYPGS